MLNTKIIPHLDNLDKLNKIYSWIPNSNQIRPSKHIAKLKEKFFIKIEAFYNSFKDYVLIELFKSERKYNKLGKLVTSGNIISENLFLPNNFPYELNKNTYHYVMWYNKLKKDLTEVQITSDIRNSLNNIVNNKKYKFVWYENPKMNIKDIYHVQVFWSKTHISV